VKSFNVVLTRSIKLIRVQTPMSLLVHRDQSTETNAHRESSSPNVSQVRCNLRDPRFIDQVAWRRERPLTAYLMRYNLPARVEVFGRIALWLVETWRPATRPQRQRKLYCGWINCEAGSEFAAIAQLSVRTGPIASVRRESVWD
jgi:hypothetical protein